MRTNPILFSAIITLAVLSAARGQAPTPPIVVQAMPATAPAKVAPVAVAAPSNPATAKTLEEIKAANEAIIAKQAATLQQLDEMEKAADQIKIYTKRG